MAVCSSCGKKLPFFGGCGSCETIEFEKQRELADAERIAKRVAAEELREAEVKKKKEIDSIIVTTETASNLNVLNRIKVIVVACESAFSPLLVEKHDDLLNALKAEAHALGANAVVGVSFSVVEVYTAATGLGAAKTFRMFAHGTAVSIENW